MATITQIIADIDLRYRNTFTVSQKLVWLNEEQRELFDILELDSPPYAFTTVEGENFYPFPAEFDMTKIKTVTMQNDDTANPQYIEIAFKRNDDNQFGVDVWYTIVSDTFFLYVPSTVPGNRVLYIYCDSEPTEVTTANVNAAPDLPTKFQEILKLGVLKRIAGARKDVTFQNNFDMEREQKIQDVLWQRKLAEPEFIQPVDNQPRANNWWAWGNYRYGAPYWGG